MPPAIAWAATPTAPNHVNNFFAPMSIERSNEPDPKYATPTEPQISGAISGTDFEFGVYVEWLPVGHPDVDPNGLQYMRLEVSGTALDGKTSITRQLVASHDWSTYNGKHPIWWQIGARIDTTHFKTGSNLTVYAEGKAVDSDWIIEPNSWTFLINNGILENGNYNLYNYWVNAVQKGKGAYLNEYLTQLNGMNTFIDTPPFSQWQAIPDFVSGNEGLNSQALLYFIPQYSVFDILTHGNIATLTGAYGDPETSDDAFGASNVAGYVNNKSAMQAPYTFVYMSACLVMGDKVFGPLYRIPRPENDTRMAAAFLEGNTAATLPNASNSFDRDRAAVGFQYTVGSSLEQAIFSENVANYLMGGFPLYDSISSAASLGSVPPCVTSAVFDTNNEKVLTNTEKYTPLLPTIEGDIYMTLHGLYLHGTPLDNGLPAGSIWFYMDDDQPYTGPE